MAKAFVVPVVQQIFMIFFETEFLSLVLFLYPVTI